MPNIEKNNSLIEKIKKTSRDNVLNYPYLQRFVIKIICRFCRVEKLKNVQAPPLTTRSGARLFIFDGIFEVFFEG